MENFSLQENTEIGQVYELEASDANNDKLQYGIKSSVFEVKPPGSSQVFLKGALDYEKKKEYSVTVWVSDGKINTTENVIVHVINVNDELPVFQSDSYSIDVREDTEINRTVLANVIVKDEEEIDSLLQVECYQPKEACETFEIVQTSVTNTTWTGDIHLLKSLDYEKRKSYQLVLRATDGINTRLTSIPVRVLNVQDTPPKFLPMLTYAIEENYPVGKSFMTIQAVDGDGERPIRYFLEPEFTLDMFNLDPVTGNLSPRRPMDRENIRLNNGFIKVTFFKAREVLEGGGLGNDELTQTRTEITLTIVDQNDNAPKFKKTNYEIELEASKITDGYFLPRVFLNVTDPDSSINGHFKIFLLNFDDMFQVIPNEGINNLLSKIQIRNATKLISAAKSYTLELEARETKSVTPISSPLSKATILLKIKSGFQQLPSFQEESYTVDIQENAEGGSLVTIIKLPVDNVKYELIGNGASLFEIGEDNGEIRVKFCPLPGKSNCIDYEQKTSYNLNLIAKNNKGQSQTTLLLINVINANDEKPKFLATKYTAYTREGTIRLDPPLNLKAIDKDEDSQLVYSIINSDVANSFNINSLTGKLTLIKPLDYESSKNGIYTLTIRVTDGKNVASALVEINVMNVNEAVPVFKDTVINVLVNETVNLGERIAQFEATDEDLPSQIDYRIGNGSRGDFNITQDGQVRVTNHLDFDRNKNYLITVSIIFSLAGLLEGILATDRGQPQKTATATLSVNIQDRNNKYPYFNPITTRISIERSIQVSSVIKQMEAIDMDNTILSYKFIEPTLAWNRFGQLVQNNLTQEYFKIDENGRVSLIKSLENSEISRIRLTIQASDIEREEQTGIGVLDITIIRRNEIAPKFPSPWTPTNRNLYFSVLENQDAGYYVGTVTATDPFDHLDSYRITFEDIPGLFVVDKNGILRTRTLLDREKIDQSIIRVVVSDNGKPQLSSTATVTINIIDINDHTPIFDKINYDKTIDENLGKNKFVLQVGATDGDNGNYGDITYTLNDDLGAFQINPTTGRITVKDPSILDREQRDVIYLTVTATDSPKDTSVSRSSKVIVRIFLRDLNDNRPVFDKTVRDKIDIIETISPDESFLKVIASDKDSGDNGKVKYRIESGNDDGIFDIDPDTGNVKVKKSLVGQSNNYQLTIEAKDEGKPTQLSSKYKINIRVLKSNNNAPYFVKPENNIIQTQEEEGPGALIVKVVAEDDDKDEVTYSFIEDGKPSHETSLFKIDLSLGEIYLKERLDREKKSVHVLVVQAKDNGIPSKTATKYLIINVTDIDDHSPEFLSHRNCCSIPYKFYVSESIQVNTSIGKVRAIDRDEGKNAQFEYLLKDKNLPFRVDKSTGEIIAIEGQIDYEKQSKYVFEIQASTKPAEASLKSNCKCKDNSKVRVTVYVKNEEDEDIQFDDSVKDVCVTDRTKIGTPLLVLEAKDPDDMDALEYRLVKNSSKIFFSLNSQSGLLSTASVFDRRLQKLHNITVRASNTLSTSSAERYVNVWVTEHSKEKVVTINEKEEVVLDKLNYYMKKIAERNGLVCVIRVGKHVTNSGEVNTDKTDVVIHVLREGIDVGAVKGEDELANLGIIFKKSKTGAELEILWVLLAVILIFIIWTLLSFIILFCCCCCRKDKQQHVLVDNVNKGFDMQEGRMILDYSDKGSSNSLRDMLSDDDIYVINSQSANAQSFATNQSTTNDSKQVRIIAPLVSRQNDDGESTLQNNASIPPHTLQITDQQIGAYLSDGTTMKSTSSGGFITVPFVSLPYKILQRPTSSTT
ncbi:DgyrCDS12639 [Dimorphilus gyrociliatus]|uniref:DgyrCDS12639 n=1 Tax=Dimorphilus gyrociliatus TaxID=2664684 RepID=A0A7I8W809_9ANNE|nr:DgyrCDS12639 [Dimorphilus gyrociliatus]